VTGGAAAAGALSHDQAGQCPSHRIYGAIDDFSVRTGDGESLVARRLILGYGVVDQMSDVRFVEWRRVPLHSRCAFHRSGPQRFSLQAVSAAVDATTILMSNVDMDGKPRMVDLAIVPNKYPAKGANSTGDLGAYERQSVGNLVLNPAFDVDLRLWTDVAGVVRQHRCGAGSR
jgi:hypothetical protein